MLSDTEVIQLTNLIRDSFRIRPNHNPDYVDISGHLTRFSSKQHQIVFGRRGSGKSCLFVHFLNNSDASNGILPIYIEGDEFKRLTYPDLLVRLLLSIFEKMPDAGIKWRRLIRRPNKIQKNIDDLREILSKAEESSIKQTDGSSSEGNVGLSKGPVKLGGKKTKKKEKQREFKEQKLDHLERYLSDYKGALISSLANSKYDSAYILLDDFYLIPRGRQPDVIDYLHRLVRGTDFYIKIGTVRHRTTILRNEENTIGVELHQDIEEISLDRTLEDIDSTSEYLSRMLESVAHKAGLDHPKETLFNPGAFHALSLASGGVPRDFLNIFVEAVSSSLSDGKEKWLTPTYIWKGASRLSYRTKLNNLKEEGVSDSSPLERLYRDIVSFCLKEKRKTAFLLSRDQTQLYTAVHELIQQLMDFKLIHIIEPDTSAASGRKGRFEAYTLDFSLFMEPRLRNVVHVEFWKTDNEGRRIGVREAPIYDLEMAQNRIRNITPVATIEDILGEVDDANV
ncbi:hypothetical protein [Marinagarivorans cellulosilyticus]|uniref:Uncharacterized protein n=1 Tax=Marinagarivorans cellulosilyticus TaxID=2721545 RepID=A0AAN1WLL8_9GAMM|nr:hypothetical protein [Marinagarivorans cellulosilyticus]BCD99847.1 hypothetical protein MARGE09_P4049 [Marinagarivorans cellulosilyticus]